MFKDIFWALKLISVYFSSTVQSVLLLYSPAQHVNNSSPAVQYVWFGWHWGQERSLMLKLCLHDFAGQSLHYSIISRGKEQSLCYFVGQRTKAPGSRGAKSALLHNFAGQSPHCSLILRGKDIVLRAKKQQQMRFTYFSQFFLVNYCNIKNL